MAPFPFLSQKHDLIKLITISILLASILLSGMQPLFSQTLGERINHDPLQSLPSNIRLCKEFWEREEYRDHFPDGNALFDFANEATLEKKLEIGSYLRKLASFPSTIASEALYEYIYVALAPTKTSAGIAIVGIERNGTVELTQISLRPTAKKIAPRLEHNIWIDEVGVSMEAGKHPRARFLMHIEHRIAKDSYPTYQDWNACIFYTEADIARYDVTAKIRGMAYSASSLNRQTSIPFELELKPIRHFVGEDFRVPIPKEPNDILVRTSVHFKDQTNTSYTKSLSYYTNNPVVEVQRPSRISVTMPSEILETQTFDVRDHTSAKARKKVFIDDVLLGETETKQFFQGQYLFPLIGKDKIYRISIVYESGENFSDRVVFSDNVLVYTVKPHLQIAATGLHKHNRIITSAADWGLSAFAKKYVKVQTPEIKVHSSQGVITTLTERGRIKFYVPSKPNDTATDNPIQITAQTSIQIDPSVVERPIPETYRKVVSAPYEIQLTQDIPPAIFALPAIFAHPRNSAPEIFIKCTSLDGDSILETHYELKKKEHEGLRVIEQGPVPLISESKSGKTTADIPANNSTSNSGTTKLRLPKLALGTYELVIRSKEKASGEIAPNLPSLVSEKTVPLVVQNLAPITQLRVLKKTNLTPFDVIVTTTEKTYGDIVSQHHIEIANALREHGFDVRIRHKDLAHYSDTKYVEQSVETGRQYPKEQYNYNANGYQGVLNRYDVSTATSLQEGGRYVSIEKSETVEERVPNTSGGSAVFTWMRNRWICTKPWKGKVLPDTRTKDCPNGGKVVLRKVGAINNNDEVPPRRGTYEGEKFEIPFDWTAIYNGVCTRTVQVWEPSTTTVHTYTGYYKGNVSTHFQKPYLETLRYPTSKIELDFTTSEATKEALQSLIYEALQKESIPANIILVGEEIDYEMIDKDPDEDPTQVKSIVYDHDPSVFDNPTKSTPIVGTKLANRLSSAGKYVITRTIQDLPPDRKDQKESRSSVELLVHRKPVAKFDAYVAAITAQNGQNAATLRLQDLSYDPDFQTRDEQRGIVRRIYRYRAFDPTRDTVTEAGIASSGVEQFTWIYDVPSTLPVGKYVISLVVQDKYGAWSDEYTKLVDATQVDSLEIAALLRGLDGHPTTAIPAGERLQIYQVTTKYKDKHKLQYLFPTEKKEWAFEEAKALDAHKYEWKDWSYTIPSDTPDGPYEARVVGTPSGEVILPYVVNTPIHIRGEVLQSETLKLVANTSKYAAEATVTAFAGTKYETKRTMRLIGTEGDEKIWSIELSPLDITMPSDSYRFDFWASTESGKTATDRKNKQLTFLSIHDVKLKGGWNKWNTYRFLGYEKIEIKVQTRGKAESVSIRFSPELEAMTYQNAKGDIYRYIDEFGYTVSFPLALKKANTGASSSSSTSGFADGALVETWEGSYILPIAPSTIDWKDKRIRPNYQMFVEARSNHRKATHTTNLDITGNIHDLMYIRPSAER